MTKLQNIFILIFLCISSFFGIGCSVFDTTISPQYGNPIIDTKASCNMSIKVNVSGANNSSNAKLVGVKKNEFGLEVADIYTDTPSTQFLQQALEKELKVSGFNIVQQSNGKTIVLEININQHFVEPEVKLVYSAVYGALESNVTVITPWGESYQRKFMGIGKIIAPVWYSSLPLGGDSIYAASFEIATKNFIQKVIPAVYDLLQRCQSSQSTNS